MNTVYPLKTLSQLRPLLVGFRKAKGLTQKTFREAGRHSTDLCAPGVKPCISQSGAPFRVFNVLGIEIVFSSELASPGCETEEISTIHIDSPARREQW